MIFQPTAPVAAGRTAYRIPLPAGKRHFHSKIGRKSHFYKKTIVQLRQRESLATDCSIDLRSQVAPRIKEYHQLTRSFSREFSYRHTSCNLPQS